MEAGSALVRFTEDWAAAVAGGSDGIDASIVNDQQSAQPTCDFIGNAIDIDFGSTFPVEVRGSRNLVYRVDAVPPVRIRRCASASRTRGRGRGTSD